jgi:hypothetical protein
VLLLLNNIKAVVSHTAPKCFLQGVPDIPSLNPHLLMIGTLILDIEIIGICLEGGAVVTFSMGSVANLLIYLTALVGFGRR